MRDASARSAAGVPNPVVSTPPIFPPHPPGDVCRVLCVDDDPVTQRILVAALVRPGFSVECVGDGQDALERFAGDARGFDVLVTDHQMPRVDGLELVRRLRGRGFAGAVIVVSALVTGADGAAYRSLGAAAVLDKPINIVALRRAADAVARVPAAGRTPVRMKLAAPADPA